MRAGKLDQKVVIQSPPTAVDSTTGAITGDWTDTETVWAAVRDLRTSERADLGVQLGQRVIELTMRPTSSLSPDKRLELTDRDGTTVTFYPQPAAGENSRGDRLVVIATDFQATT